MVKTRSLMLLFTLGLLITTTVFVGHFIADAVCVLIGSAAEYGCTADIENDGSSGSSSPESSAIHGTLSLPPTFPPLSMIAQAFILTAAAIFSFTYSPSPSPPPPKLFS